MNPILVLILKQNSISYNCYANYNTIVYITIINIKIIFRRELKVEWILFDKDGTLIEFDSSWEKLAYVVDQLLETFPVHDKAAHRQLGIIDKN